MSRPGAVVLIVGALVWSAMAQLAFSPFGPADWAPLGWIWLSGCSVGALLGVVIADRRP